MADINSSKWMEEDVLNVAPPPDGLPAGTPPTSLYDIIRADKGAIKRKDTRENPAKSHLVLEPHTFSHST